MGKLVARLRSLFGNKDKSVEQPDTGNQPPAEGRSPPPDREQTRPLTERLQQRIRRVSESFLDNERLTADLDDPAAQELLDWGLELGRRIVQGTVDFEDDERAQEEMYPRLRAVRRLMRDVNRWVVSEQERDFQASRQALDRIIEQAQLIYGRGFEPPSGEQRAGFLQAQSEFLGSPPRLIANLRQLFRGVDDAQHVGSASGDSFTAKKENHDPEQV